MVVVVYRPKKTPREQEYIDKMMLVKLFGLVWIIQINYGEGFDRAIRICPNVNKLEKVDKQL